MTWALFRAGVHDAIVAACGAHPGAVVWGNAAQPIANPVVRLFLSAVREPAPAREVRTALPAGTYARALYCVRECTVQVRTETNDHGTGDAAEYSDTIRTGLELQAAKAVLAATGVVFVEAKDLGDVSFQGHDDRTVCAHIFDLIVRWAYTRQDPTGLGVIEHVEVSGDYENPTGTYGPETIPAIED